MRWREAPTRRDDAGRARSGRRARPGPAVRGAGRSPAAAVEAQRELEGEVRIERLEGPLLLAGSRAVSGGEKREGEVEAGRCVTRLEAESVAESLAGLCVLAEVHAGESEVEVSGREAGLGGDRAPVRLVCVARPPVARRGAPEVGL